jgi:hypothetical protein
VRKSLFSSLALSVAFVFAGADFATAQNASANSNAPQVVKKDLKLELQILDYRVRKVLQDILDGATGTGQIALGMYKTIENIDHVQKMQYLLATAKQLLDHKDESVRGYGVRWVDYLHPAGFPGLDSEVEDIVTRLISLAQTSSSIDMRRAVLSPLADLGASYPAEQDRCFEAMLKAAQDDDVIIKTRGGRGALKLLDPTSSQDFRRVHAALESLAQSDDAFVKRQGENFLKALNEVKMLIKLTVPAKPTNLVPGGM